MTRSRDETATVLAIVDAAYGGVHDPDEWIRTLRLLAEAFNGSAAALGEVDRFAPDKVLTVMAGAMDAGQIGRYPTYAHLDPMPSAIAGVPVGRAVTSANLFSAAEQSRMQFVNEYLKPMDAEEAMACCLTASNGRLAIMSILRPRRFGAFDHDDLAKLDRLTPHLSRALSLRRDFAQQQLQTAALGAIAERSHTGLIGLPARGAALFVNAAMRAIAAQDDGIALDRQGRLVLIDRAAALRVAAIEADVANDGPGGSFRAHRPSGKSPYILTVSRLPGAAGVELTATRDILVSVHDPAQVRRPAPQRIAQLLGLTPGAARLVHAMLEGYSLQEYAGQANVSLNTVKSHLRVAFARTDTHTQADLMRFVVTAMHALEPHLTDGR